ncbi:MAG: hypothetical protein IJ867_08890 [Clostridia bacterium]|nr:hypothetical protein [Clostridia bacterium]
MEDEIDIKELLTALWRKKIVIIVVTCIFFILGMVLYGGLSKSNPVAKNEDKKNNYYKTEFILARGKSKELDGEIVTYKLSIDSGVLINLTKFATAQNFLEKVISEMNLSDTIEADELREKISFSCGEKSDVIMLAIAYDDEVAIPISEEILSEIKDKIMKLYEIDGMTIIDGPRKATQDDIENEIAIETEGEEVVEEITEKAPSKKKVVLITGIGFVLCCGVIIVMELFNDSIKNERELEKATNARVLTNIFREDKNITEKINLLRVALKEQKVILVTSPNVGAGATYVASRLVKSYEEMGQKAILVEANDLTENKIKELENSNDIVIVDSENILDSAKTLFAVRYIKNTVLVSEERKTNIEEVIKAKANVEGVGGKLLGNVLNKSNKK